MGWEPAPTNTGWLNVRTLGDLPAPVANAITLPDGTALQFAAGVIDLQGNYLAPVGNLAIVGTSSETTTLKSTGLVGAFIRSSSTLRIRDINFEDFGGVSSLLALDGLGTPNKALDWTAVNFTNCSDIGTIGDYANFIYDSGAWLNSSGMVFDKSMDTVSIETSLVNPGAGSIGIHFLNTCVINRRFRAVFSAFVILPGETGIKIDDVATTFPLNQSFFLLNTSFSGGGTFLDGIDETDNQALIQDTTGIPNSSDVGHFFMIANATATLNSGVAIGVFLKVAGATTDGGSVAKFVQTDNKAEYVGALTSFFDVTIAFTATAGNNNELSFKVAKNGVVIDDSEVIVKANAAGRVESGTTFTVLQLTAADFVEVWCANTTIATDIVVENMRLTALRVT